MAGQFTTPESDLPQYLKAATLAARTDRDPSSGAAVKLWCQPMCCPARPPPERPLLRLRMALIESGTVTVVGPSERRHKIEEYAPIVIRQIREAIREVSEIVPDAHFCVLADMSVDRGKEASL